MATTHFSGPLEVADSIQADGSIQAGGTIKSGIGFVKMAQTASWTQDTTAAETGIVIPANSQITEIIINITTATAEGNISMGTTSASDELFTALASGSAANVFVYGSTGTKSNTGTWSNVGDDDVPIYINFSAGTTGAGVVTVEYIQAINNS